MAEEVDDGDLQELKTASFLYQFVSKGNTYRLKVPLKLPFEGNAREYAVRLIAAHRIPCHLEDDLCKRLQAFSRDATLEMLDKMAERKFYGGSVFEKVGVSKSGGSNRYSHCQTHLFTSIIPIQTIFTQSGQSLDSPSGKNEAFLGCAESALCVQ